MGAPAPIQGYPIRQLKASFPDPRPALEGRPRVAGGPKAEGRPSPRAATPRVGFAAFRCCSCIAAAGRGAEGGEEGWSPGQEGGREGAEAVPGEPEVLALPRPPSGSEDADSALALLG